MMGTHAFASVYNLSVSAASGGLMTHSPCGGSVTSMVNTNLPGNLKFAQVTFGVGDFGVGPALSRDSSFNSAAGAPPDLGAAPSTLSRSSSSSRDSSLAPAVSKVLTCDDECNICSCVSCRLQLAAINEETPVNNHRSVCSLMNRYLPDNFEDDTYEDLAAKAFATASAFTAEDDPETGSPPPLLAVLFSGPFAPEEIIDCSF